MYMVRVGGQRTRFDRVEQSEGRGDNTLKILQNRRRAVVVACSGWGCTKPKARSALNPKHSTCVCSAQPVHLISYETQVLSASAQVNELVRGSCLQTSEDCPRFGAGLPHPRPKRATLTPIGMATPTNEKLEVLVEPVTPFAPAPVADVVYG